MALNAFGEEVSPNALAHVRASYDVTVGTHGTVLNPAITDRLVPPSVHGGRKSYEKVSADDRVYYTAKHYGEFAEPHNNRYIGNSERSSWSWAVSAASRTKAGEASPNERAVVHDVVPEGRIDTDPNSNPQGTRGGAATADALRITNTHWIPPPRENQVVQGTLEHINWNQFGPASEEHNWKISSPNPEPPPTIGDEERAAEEQRRPPPDPNQGSLF